MEGLSQYRLAMPSAERNSAQKVSPGFDGVRGIAARGMDGIGRAAAVEDMHALLLSAGEESPVTPLR